MIDAAAPEARTSLTDEECCMWKWLLHFGTIGDYNNVSFTCPPDPSGGAATLGFYDGVSVASAYDILAAASIAAVLVIVLAIYMGTDKALGPRFIKRWYKGLAIAAVVCGILGYAVLSIAPTHAFGGTCPSNPAPFPLRLPASLIVWRTLAGILWGAVAYFVFSIVLTATAGRFASLKNGFFHNRGCPLPRLVP